MNMRNKTLKSKMTVDDELFYKKLASKPHNVVNNVKKRKRNKQLMNYFKLKLENSKIKIKQNRKEYVSRSN